MTENAPVRAPVLEATVAEIEEFLLSQGRPMASGTHPHRSEIAYAIGRPFTTVRMILDRAVRQPPSFHRFHEVVAATYKDAGRKKEYVKWWWVDGVPCPTVIEPPDTAPWVPPGYAVKHRDAAVLTEVGMEIRAVVEAAGHPVRRVDMGDIDDRYKMPAAFGDMRSATVAAARYDSPARGYVTSWSMHGRIWFWLPETPLPAGWLGTRKRVLRHQALSEADPLTPRLL